MAEQFFEWQLISKQSKITLLMLAAIIGVVGSILSITKQLAGYLRDKE